MNSKENKNLSNTNNFKFIELKHMRIEKEEKEEKEVKEEVYIKSLRKDNENFNIIIEGDCVDALSILNESYEKKIDLIYIDPPYNTGKTSFEYKDDYLDWDKLMKKSLKEAKKLLSDNGCIFISIDEKKIDTLIKILNDVFSEKNRKGIFKVQVRNPERITRRNAFINNSIEYLVLYCMDIKKCKLKRVLRKIKVNDYKYKIYADGGIEEEIGDKKVEIIKPCKYSINSFNDIEDKEILRKVTIRGKNREENSTCKFYINHLKNRINEDGKGCLYKVYGIGEDGLGYRYIGKGEKNQGEYYQGIPTIYRTEAKKKNIKLEDVEIEWPYSDFIDFTEESQKASSIVSTMVHKKYNINPKALELMEFILNMFDNNITVLDFFAGSGTMGHAVLKLNKHDKGKRKFILCQNSEGKKSGNICKSICYTRLKSCIEGYHLKKKFIAGTGGNLKYLQIN